MQRQSMHRARQFISQNLVDRLMTPHFDLALKIRRHQRYLEMGFRSGWHRMHMALVFHRNQTGIKAFGQLLFNAFLYFHRSLTPSQPPPPILPVYYSKPRKPEGLDTKAPKRHIPLPATNPS